MLMVGRLLLVIAGLGFVVNGQSATGFKSVLKCKEYAKIKYGNPMLPSRIYFPGTVALVPPASFPYMATMFGIRDMKEDLRCGGVLISERAVLAPARCIASRLAFVRLGHVSDMDSERYTIFKNVTHPQYSTKNYYNNIGVIILKQTVQFNSMIRPACLQLTRTIPKEGWLMHILEYNSSIKLSTYSSKEVNSDDCQQQFTINQTPYGVVDYLQMCVLENRTRRSYTAEEGHAALVRRDSNNQQFYVIGIPSIGLLRDIPVPSLSSRVSSYIEWIESIVWQSSPMIGCSNVTFQL